MREGRTSVDHEQTRNPREVRDKVVGYTVAEVVLPRVATQIGKRQHRDRRDARQWQGGLFLRRNRRRSVRRLERYVLDDQKRRDFDRNPG
jgi:hypothetical protein